LEKGQDPDYQDLVQPGDARSQARCACFFAARTHNGENWRNYFNAHQVIGGHKGFLFISEQDEIDVVARRIAPAYGSRAAVFYRIVGKPKFGVASDSDFDDYAIRLRLRVPDTEFYVPSLIDAEAYEFFLPNGQRDPRRGRTVYVGWPPTYPVSEGVAEWVHGLLTLGECLVDLEPVGPVSDAAAPPPHDSLLRILLARPPA
jgi:hypothetical protein